VSLKVIESGINRSADPENLTLEANITSIGKLVVKLWLFLYIHDGRQPPSWILSNHNSAIQSTDPENPNLEPNMEWIGYTVCEMFAFKVYCDLETGVRVTQGHRKRHSSIEHI